MLDSASMKANECTLRQTLQHVVESAEREEDHNCVLISGNHLAEKLHYVLINWLRGLNWDAFGTCAVT